VRVADKMAADAPRNEGPPPRVRLVGLRASADGERRGAESRVQNVSANGRGVTASIRNEDHTLGNALRWACVQSRDVNFCGYSIPHPSEPVMNIRVQTDGEARPLRPPRAPQLCSLECRGRRS
jgi:DNA-directed RNA polymerase subunit L